MVLAYFGKRWDAPVTDEAPQVDVPVGEPCVFCPEPIAAEDRGMVIRAWMGGRGPEQPAHLECWLCSSLASLEHLRRQDAGLHCGAECNVSDRTMREEGRAMMEYIASKGGPS